MIKKQKVVVFDFDGTLSASDANKEFVKHCFRHSLRPWLFLPILGIGLVFRKLESRECDVRHSKIAIMWRQMSRRFLTKEMVAKLAPGFIKEHIKRRFDWAKARVAAEHFSPDVKVLLISAGPDYLIPGLVKDMKFDAVLCSRMEPERPWKFKFLCYGWNKVSALDEWAEKNKCMPDVVRSYGDSYSDKPIMALARKQVWISAT
jgi:HAD superfamily phosphoserine phosphatase-like hydrolase